jgi:hypothetical protein
VSGFSRTWRNEMNARRLGWLALSIGLAAFGASALVQSQTPKPLRLWETGIEQVAANRPERFRNDRIDKSLKSQLRR